MLRAEQRDIASDEDHRKGSAEIKPGQVGFDPLDRRSRASSFGEHRGIDIHADDVDSPVRQFNGNAPGPAPGIEYRRRIETQDELRLAVDVLSLGLHGVNACLIFPARLADETRNRNLLLVEEEMARLLEAAGRQGSTLSAMIRLLFDGGTLTRNCVSGETEAKDYFCGLVGHITPEELRLRLSASDQTNGLANRFLFIASHARQSVIWFQDDDGRVNLPTSTPGVTVGDLARQGASTGFLKLGTDARDWLKRAHASRCYASNNPLLGRLWTHFCRIAVVYAVLDGSKSVEICHLEAAAAIVDYAEATTAMVFPSRPVATLADKIRQAVVRAGEDGVTLTELSKALPRGLAPTERDAAVGELKTEGSIEEIRVPGSGRTSTKLVAAIYLEASTEDEGEPIE